MVKKVCNKQPHLMGKSTEWNMGMKGMSNISINTRMRQFLILIALILGGILFALTAKSWNSESNRENLKADVTESFK
jgi:hypothetical protein